jgi:hypothetical protein
VPAEPQDLVDAHDAITKLLSQLEPPQTVQWVSERTDRIMAQFDGRTAADPPASQI